MSNKTIALTFLATLIAVSGFVFYAEKRFIASKASIATTTPALQSRPAYDGCSWEEVKGIGLKFWGMRCGEMYIKTFEDTRTANLVEMKDGNLDKAYDYITVYDINNGNINDVLPELAKNPEWKESDKCAFDQGKKVGNKTIYTMRPTGETLVSLEKEEAEMPVNEVCAGYGISNDSGLRYFEVHDSNPNKALFLYVGQDAPMYDEQTIEVLK